MLGNVRRVRHPLLDRFLDAAGGRFPPIDGAVTFLPGLPDGRAAVVAFTGHACIAASDAETTLAGAEVDGFGRALDPSVLIALARGGTIGTHDVTLVARGSGDVGLTPLPATARWDDHPRVRHARMLRSDVTVHGDEHALVTIGNGLAGRLELGVELVTSADRDTPEPGVGRRLLARSLQLVPPAAPVFAAVSPGNARSLRAFLAAGFVPIASEVIITPG